jgi:hypothetical protein
MTEQDITDLIAQDEWMMDVLKTARSLSLPDWMIGAGFVRNKVWDYLHGYATKTKTASDIDLIYFDTANVDEDKDRLLSEELKRKTGMEWEVVNQAYTHKWHDRELPYEDTVSALAEWVETPTCVAVRLEEDDTLALFAPHGIDDLVNLVVRPSPSFENDLDKFWERVKGKGWEAKWPKLRVIA